MTVSQKITSIKEDIFALEDELHEAVNETSWKPWTHGDRVIHRDEYIGELVDALHFFINLCLVVDCTSDELFDRYMEKNRRNHKRQDDKYTGEKGPDGRELDRPRFASGGVITDYKSGDDSVPAILSPGEKWVEPGRQPDGGGS